MIGHSIGDVDQALYDKLSGNSTVSGETIEVFVESPSPDAQHDRAYPSISIRLLDVVEDAERREADEGEHRTAIDDPPTQATMATTGTPHRLVYAIETWARTSALQGGAPMDRELLTLLNVQLPARDAYLADVGDDDDDLWVFRTAAASAHEEHPGVVIYHRVFTYEVLVVLGPQTTSTVPVAQSIELAMYGAVHYPGQDIDTDAAANALDVTLSVTDNGVSPA